jgi:hypothetical protein
MIATRMERPNVSGTKRKWKKAATANCNLESNNTSIEISPFLVLRAVF